MTPESPQEVQVILPYKTLESLLEASVEVKKLRADVKRLNQQQAALRYQFLELLEQLRIE